MTVGSVSSAIAIVSLTADNKFIFRVYLMCAHNCSHQSQRAKTLSWLAVVEGQQMLAKQTLVVVDYRYTTVSLLLISDRGSPCSDVFVGYLPRTVEGVLVGSSHPSTALSLI
jgi:hypothetical protein